MSQSESPPLSAAQMDVILEYIPRLEAPDFSPGEWQGGAGQMPYFRDSDTVSDFRRALSQQGVLIVFDWPAWQTEAERYMQDPQALAAAPLIDLRRLLTTHIRADRFHEGHFASVVEDGHILAILRRLRQIRAEME